MVFWLSLWEAESLNCSFLLKDSVGVLLRFLVLQHNDLATIKAMRPVLCSQKGPKFITNLEAMESKWLDVPK